MSAEATISVTAGTNLATVSIRGTIGSIGHIINNNVDYFILRLMGQVHI
ncbi:MAG: hypothetical protein H0X03_09560 [Nitrosopumilus sp.]|nr:hypothetical protein [Nitrosopumilus sp.]